MINDIFNEQLVKKQRTGSDLAKATGIWGGAVLLSLLLIWFIPYIGFMLAVLVFWGAFTLAGRTNKEYEYIFTNGDLDIDVIFNQAKRKRLVSIDSKRILAFEKVQNKEQIRQKYQAVMDCSSGTISDSLYALVYDINHKKTAVLIEPNEAILKGIRTYAPKTVTGYYGSNK